MTLAIRLVAALDAALLVVLAVAGGVVITAGRARADEAGLTRAQVDETLRAHNAWRDRVGAAPLAWAPDLAALAQARAAYLAAHGCVIEHGPLANNVGENLFHAGPLHGVGRQDEVGLVTPTQVVDTWGEESADYSREHDTCAPGRVCGHYTQIVWAATREVGCGTSVCPTLGQIWVCNYRPRGNTRILR